MIENNKLTDIIYKKNKENAEPLAYRMRPRSLEDVLGQDDILSKNKLLYKMIKNDLLSSIILYGPLAVEKQL